MSLPDIPYSGSKTQRRITSFLGLNYTENYKDGEFEDMAGLSSENYPVLSQRNSRQSLSGLGLTDDLFEWDGKLITIRNRQVYYGDEAIAAVSEGKKQFCVVGTRLIIYPDAIWVDLNSYEQGALGASVISSSLTTTEFDGAPDAPGSIQMAVNPVVHGGLSANTEWRKVDDGPGSRVHWLYTDFVCFSFGTDVADIEACWEDGAWVDDIEERGEWKYATWTNGKMFGNIPQMDVGEIFIPNVETGFPSAMITRYYEEDPDGHLPDSFSPGNDNGFYGKTTAFTHIYNRNYGGDIYDGWRVDYEIFRIGYSNPLFSSTYFVGDFVDISGAGDDDYNKKRIEIMSIDDATNTLYFREGTFAAPYSATETIVITRSMPELDYICEKSNRLVGVSNKDKSIYVSALGLPWQFWDYSSESGAWSVAVGSEGDFTAICSYGGAVLCFKEQRLVKLLGSYPSEYYTAEYELFGVENGSSRSLVNINDVLYYKGKSGVYAYTGGSPQLISSVFGQRMFTEATGGKDGLLYLLSMKDEEGGYTFAYNIVRGLWMKEDDVYTDAFTSASDTSYRLINRTVYEEGGDEVFDWYGEFKPFVEVATSDNSTLYGAFAHKGYSKILLRLDMEQGSTFTVKVKEDRGPWRPVHVQRATRDMTVRLPVRIGRCDRYHIRIEGRGRVIIHTLGREFTYGSERKR